MLAASEAITRMEADEDPAIEARSGDGIFNQ